MSIYKRYSNKTKCMYFMIIDEIFFDKYMTIWEKVNNIKYIKAGKRFNTIESFQCHQ